MKKIITIAMMAILVLVTAPTSASADMWSRMFKVKKVENNPQDLYEYGQQVGYNDRVNGQNNYAPSNEPFVRGYYNGQHQAIRDERIQYYNNQNQVQQPVIVIYQNGIGTVVQEDGYKEDRNPFYDH